MPTLNGRPDRGKIGRDFEQTMDEGGGWSDGGSSSLKRTGGRRPQDRRGTHARRRRRGPGAAAEAAGVEAPPLRRAGNGEEGGKGATAAATTGARRGYAPLSSSRRRLWRRQRWTGPQCRIRREFGRILQAISDRLDDLAERASQDRRNAAEMVPRRSLPKAEELSPPLTVG